MFGSIVAVILFLWCVFLVLAALVPRRFGWLIFLITGSISLGSVYYFYDSYLVRGESISHPETRRPCTRWICMGYISLFSPSAASDQSSDQKITMTSDKLSGANFR